MKTLIVVRHAKSSWTNLELNDFDRPLNDRGKRDAPIMAQRLLDKKIDIGMFVSSPAKRAKQTCLAFCEAYNLDTAKVAYIDKLYHAPANVFYDVIKELETTEDTVAIFSHNPGITDFVNSLCNSVSIDNMPTCGVFTVGADIEYWKDFASAAKQFLFFDYPKLS